MTFKNRKRKQIVRNTISCIKDVWRIKDSEKRLIYINSCREALIENLKILDAYDFDDDIFFYTFAKLKWENRVYRWFVKWEELKIKVLELEILLLKTKKRLRV